MVDVARVNLYGQPIGSVRWGLCSTRHRAFTADDASTGGARVQFRGTRQDDL